MDLETSRSRPKKVSKLQRTRPKTSSKVKDKAEEAKEKAERASSLTSRTSLVRPRASHNQRADPLGLPSVIVDLYHSEDSRRP